MRRIRRSPASHTNAAARVESQWSIPRGGTVDASIRHRLGERGARAGAERHALADNCDDGVAMLWRDTRNQTLGELRAAGQQGPSRPRRPRGSYGV